MNGEGTSPVFSDALKRLLRGFFHHLYHGLAWTYDFVSAFVSVGRWDTWIKSVVPLVRDGRVLELGHGTGHLQGYLRGRNLALSVGLDESTEMGALARRRLRSAGYGQFNLTRAAAQHLPFSAESFSAVVSTFPSEYILDTQTLSEVHRVLDRSGQMVVLPAAWILGPSLPDRVAAWIFRFTRQVPLSPPEQAGQQFLGPLRAAGFQAALKVIELGSSIVLVIIAAKLPAEYNGVTRESW